MSKRLVIVESPYAGPDAATVERNVRYAQACIRDCLQRGEAPFASHLLYTQPGVLDDGKPEERELGIEAGLAWGAKADATVLYEDLGISLGMAHGVRHATSAGRPVEYRRLGGEWAARSDAEELRDPFGSRTGSGSPYGSFLTADECGPYSCTVSPYHVGDAFGDVRREPRELGVKINSDGWLKSQRDAGDLKPRGHKAPLHLIPWDVVPTAHVPDRLLECGVRCGLAADEPLHIFQLAELLLYDVEIEAVAYALDFGRKKYGRDNWKLASWNEEARDEYWSAICRHLVAYHNDEECAPDSGVDHRAHAAAGCLIYLWHERRLAAVESGS